MSRVQLFMKSAKDYLEQEKGEVGLQLYNTALALPNPIEQARHLKLIVTAVSRKNFNVLKKELLKPKGVVSLDVFLHNDYYLGLKGQIYPKLLPYIHDINSGDYVEAVLTGAIGTAKALDVDTPIPSPTGYILNGDLVSGSIIYGGDGKPCKVIQAHPIRHGRPCYKVQFSDGTHIVADADHNWFTTTRADRFKKSEGTYRRFGGVKTTKEISKTLLSPDGKHKNHAIPLCSAVTGTHMKTPIDPYVFGAWLGGGSKEGNKFWSEDYFIINEIRKHFKVKHLGDINYTIYGLQECLHYFNAVNNKTIGSDWLHADYNQRLSLVQGLLDTDGTVDKRTGCCTLVQKKGSIALPFLELLWGLGLKPTHELIESKIGNKFCGLVHRIRFTPYKNVPVFRLPRKLKYLEGMDAQSIRHRSRYIVSVVPATTRPVRCITVDSTDSLYLCGKSHQVTHNTTIAIWSTAYQLYLLSRMESPQLTYGLDTSSEILFIFQSLNKELAKEVDYARFKALIEGSPYFTDNYPFDKNIESMMKFPNRVVVKPVSGSDTAAIGQNVIGGVIDELNFMSVVENSKNNKDGGSYDQAVALYNSISRRRKTRFMDKGKLPGVLCLVSSKKYPNQFTDVKTAEALRDIEEKGSTNIYIYDKRTWDIMPDSTFTGEWFKIFIGDMTHKPLILDETMDASKFDPKLLMDIPTEYLSEFRSDMMNALRDIAGVSTLASIPFMTNVNAIGAIFTKDLPNIFTTDVCDFEYSKVGIKKKLISKINKKHPRFAHIDLGLSSDSAGLVIGHVPEFTKVDKEGTAVAMPKICIDGILEVKPPPNGEINFEKIRKLIYVLQMLDFPIVWVTMDSYQSVDTLQILRSKGIYTGLQSMDTKTIPYEVTKTCILDQRLSIPPCDKLQLELVRLERTLKGKIDHPPNGTKDIADALAGVVYGLTMQRTIWAMFGENPVGVLHEKVSDLEDSSNAKVAKN